MNYPWKLNGSSSTSPQSTLQPSWLPSGQLMWLPPPNRQTGRRGEKKKRAAACNNIYEKGDRKKGREIWSAVQFSWSKSADGNAVSFQNRIVILWSHNSGGSACMEAVQLLLKALSSLPGSHGHWCDSLHQTGRRANKKEQLHAIILWERRQEKRKGDLIHSTILMVKICWW